VQSGYVRSTCCVIHCVDEQGKRRFVAIYEASNLRPFGDGLIDRSTYNAGSELNPEQVDYQALTQSCSSGSRLKERANSLGLREEILKRTG
jgi:hypothetical protein